MFRPKEHRQDHRDNNFHKCKVRFFKGRKLEIIAIENMNYSVIKFVIKFHLRKSLIWNCWDSLAQFTSVNQYHEMVVPKSQNVILTNTFKPLKQIKKKPQTAIKIDGTVWREVSTIPLCHRHNQTEWLP